MDSRDPISAKYRGHLAATGPGDVGLLGLFLASGNSGPVRVEHGGGTAAWIVESLAVPSVWGHQQT